MVAWLIQARKNYGLDWLTNSQKKVESVEFYTGGFECQDRTSLHFYSIILLVFFLDLDLGPLLMTQVKGRI